MTTMSSMKFRTENDMSLSSTTQGLENHENPLGSPKAEDGSSRPRCRGPQGHRLKPAKTGPASKAVLFGPPSITKCTYLLMICTFSALMVSMYGGKGKISQHRRLPETKYDEYEDFATLKKKLDGTDAGADKKNKRIAGHSLTKPEKVANEFYKKVTKWKDNARALNAQAPRIHELCEKRKMKGHEDYTNKYETFADFQQAVNPYFYASESLQNCIEKARMVKHNNDFGLMKSILTEWFATSMNKLGKSRAVQNKTIEIVEKLLMRQLQWLKPKTVADVAEIVEAINITKKRTSRCIQFLTNIWRMPLPKWSELLAKGVEEKHGSIYEAYEQYEIFCDRVVHMQSFIKVQLFRGPVSLYGYESEHEFQLVDRYIGMRQNPILFLELYARRTSNPKRSECPMPDQNLNDFLRTTDGQNLVAAWVCALKDLAHDEIEWIKPLNPTDVQFWTIDLETETDSDEDLPDQKQDLRRLKRIRELHCRNHGMGGFGLPKPKPAEQDEETAPAPSQGLGALRQGGLPASGRGGLPPLRAQCHGLPAPPAQGEAEAES